MTSCIYRSTCGPMTKERAVLVAFYESVIVSCRMKSECKCCSTTSTLYEITPHPVNENDRAWQVKGSPMNSFSYFGYASPQPANIIRVDQRTPVPTSDSTLLDTSTALPIIYVHSRHPKPQRAARLAKFVRYTASCTCRVSKRTIVDCVRF
jgi:hypothetical protein